MTDHTHSVASRRALAVFVAAVVSVALVVVVGVIASRSQQHPSSPPSVRPHHSATAPVVPTGPPAQPAVVDDQNTDTPQFSGTTMTVTAQGNHQTTRAEVYWGQSSHEMLRLEAGDTITTTMTITADLGGTADDPSQWAVVWQLLGPLGSQRWPGPTLALSITEGRWKLGGGAGADGQQQQSWAPIDLPFVDGQPVTWSIKVALSPDPAAASVSIIANRRVLLADWHPATATMYADQQWIGVKTGLYMGTTGEAGVRPGRRIVTCSFPILTVTPRPGSATASTGGQPSLAGGTR